jgi:hypothetical protein
MASHIVENPLMFSILRTRPALKWLGGGVRRGARPEPVNLRTAGGMPLLSTGGASNVGEPATGWYAAGALLLAPALLDDEP